MSAKSAIALGSKDTSEAPVKTLVRNCRSTPAFPVSQNVARANTAGSNKCGILLKDADHSKDIDLSDPQLFTTLKIKDNLQKMKAGIKSVRFEQKLPTEQQPKNTRKVNIKFDEKIYKDLIDLKVTDDDLGLRAISLGKPKELPKSRDPVPLLSNYYRPSFDKEYVVKPYPPTWTSASYTQKKFERPQATSTVLKAVKRWNVDDNKLV